MKTCSSACEAAIELLAVAEADPIQGEADLLRRLRERTQTDHFRYFEHDGVEINAAFSIIKFPTRSAYLLSLYDPRGPLLDPVLALDIAKIFLGESFREETAIPEVKPVRRYSRFK